MAVAGEQSPRFASWRHYWCVEATDTEVEEHCLLTYSCGKEWPLVFKTQYKTTSHHQKCGMWRPWRDRAQHDNTENCRRQSSALAKCVRNVLCGDVRITTDWTRNPDTYSTTSPCQVLVNKQSAFSATWPINASVLKQWKIAVQNIVKIHRQHFRSEFY